MAFWPVPLFVIAAVLAALNLPGGERTTYVLIVLLNVGLVYALGWGVLGLARWLLKLEWSTARITAIVSACVMVYHLVAVAWPRPESGWVRLGFGDLMLGGGALICAGIEDAARPLHRGKLMSAEALEKSLRAETEATFKVSMAERVEDGWVVVGRLSKGDGVGASHVAKLTEPLTVTTTVLGNDYHYGTAVLSGGALHVLARKTMSVTRPGENTVTTELTADAVAWLDARGTPSAWLIDGRWVLVAADYTGAELGVLAPDGGLEFTVDLEVLDSTPTAAAQAGGVIYAVTEHYDSPARFLGHVVEGGARDSDRSLELTAQLNALALERLALVGAGSLLWVVGYSDLYRSHIAVALPDGDPRETGPGSVTAVIADGEDVIVGTHRSILRVRAGGAEQLGEVWVSENTLSVRDGVPSAAVKTRKSRDLTLTTFEPAAPRPFLPDIRLHER